MSSDDNEITIRRILRIFRNGMVGLVRARFNETFAGEAEQKLASLFQKQDARTSKTQWETMRDNAVRARAPVEVSTTVADFYEVLGVSDFNNVLEKFYSVLAKATEPLADVDKARRQSTLRCIQQIKIFRDPNAHEVTQAASFESVSLCGLNCALVLDSFGLSNDASSVRALLTDAQRKAIARAATVLSISQDDSIGRAIFDALSMEGIRCHPIKVTQATRHLIDRVGDGSRTNVVVCIPEAYTDLALDSEHARHFEGVLTRCFELGHNVIVVSDHRVSTALLFSVLSTDTRLALREPVPFLPALAKAAADMVKEALQVFPSTPTNIVTARSPLASVAEVISDQELVVKLLLTLKETQLKEVHIVSPFLTDVKPSQFGLTSLSLLLVQAEQRGCLIEVITRPPSDNMEEDPTQKHALLDLLHRGNIKVYVNPDLHSKIYTAKRMPDRVSWIVGSHNLTQRAISGSIETSLLGYRHAEFNEVSAQLERIRRHRKTEGYDFWAARRRGIAS